MCQIKYTIGYGIGSGYLRIFYWVVGLVVLGTTLKRISGQHRIVIKDGKPLLRLGFFYSMDRLLPIIQLSPRYYQVDLAGIVRYDFYFHQLMGYVLVGFVIVRLVTST